MMIMQTPQYWIKNITIIGVVAILAACGGGGGSDSSNSSSAPSIDTTPEAFSFAPLDNQLRSEEVISNSVTITGINSATTITITNGQYAIGEAAFTEAAGTITNGQSVKVKLTASENTFTETTATLTVGGVSANFTVKTQPDITPDTFSFTSAENVEPASVNTSDKVALSGFDIAVPIIIEGGEYALDDGEFTTADGEVEPGQSVTVRMTASEALTETVEAVVTIGGVAGTYVVTTLADTTAPTAEFMFPPPASMTESPTIYIRGKITDDYSSIAGAQIKINEGKFEELTLVSHEDGSASWELLVDLTLASENTITILTEDADGNIENNAAQVSVRQDSSGGSFPDADAPFDDLNGIVIDRTNGRDRLLVSGGMHSSHEREIIEVDIATGKRTVFAEGFTAGILWGLVMDESNNRILTRDNAAQIISFSLDDGKFTSQIYPELFDGYGLALNDSDPKDVKIAAAHSDGGSIFHIAPDFSAINNVVEGDDLELTVRFMVFDKSHQRYLLASEKKLIIYAVHSITGARSIISGGGKGGGDDFLPEGEAGLGEIVIDDMNNRLLVTEYYGGRLFAIDPESGDRRVITSRSIPDEYNLMKRVRGMALASPDSYVFICDKEPNAIFAVDVETGYRVYVSKN